MSFIAYWGEFLGDKVHHFICVFRFEMMEEREVICQAVPPKKNTISRGNQVGASVPCMKDANTQIGDWKGSYGRNTELNSEMTYKKLLREVLYDKEVCIQWLQEKDLIASKRACPDCDEEMVFTRCSDRSDGLKWRCRKGKGRNKHVKEVSLRKGSWFEQSNFTLEEITEYTYLWTQGMEQKQIRKELGCSKQTSVDWSMFCRETCEVLVYLESEPIGGAGKRVQIDESKFGKRKYHRGHRVEGQWVFGGIEEDTRRCFMVPVEKRDRAVGNPL